MHMEQTTPQQNLRVALSNYHNGQTVHPVVKVTSTHTKASICHAEIYWLDESDGEHLRPASFTGARRDAEDWLRGQGVHLDGLGIY